MKRVTSWRAAWPLGAKQALLTCQILWVIHTYLTIDARMPMKVLVTGTDGYIGSVLGPYLIGRGYDVVGLDTGFYRAGWLFDDRQDRPRTITRDIRDVASEDLKGFDAVVHLAELSNDPLGAHNPEITYDINYRGSMNMAHDAKAAGVGRFVYASSCSIYGVGSDDARTEQ